MNKILKGVYLVTNTSIQDQYTHTQLAKMALQGGARVVQYRDKNREARETLKQVKPVVEVCNEYNAVSIINDRVDIALASEASGVHLGQNDIPLNTARNLMGDNKIIGVTSSTLEEARRAEASGADYVAFGHIYETSTKTKDYTPRGLDVLHTICEAVSVPVVAIGGITPNNAADVIAAGASMIAVSSAICCASDPVKATEKLVNLFED